MCSPWSCWEPPSVTDGETGPREETTYPLLAELGPAALLSSSRFRVFIFHCSLLSLERKPGLHLRRRAQPVRRHRGGKGQQGASADGVLADKAGLQDTPGEGGGRVRHPANVYQASTRCQTLLSGLGTRH